MTIEEALNSYTADELGQMSFADLEKHFAQYLPTTRPDIAALKHKKSAEESSSGNKYSKQQTLNIDPALAKRRQQAKEIAAKYGIKLK